MLLVANPQPTRAERFAPEKYGIGVTLQQDSTNAILVVQCTPHGPSDTVGIQPGDRLVALDTLDVRGLWLPDVLSYLIRDEPAPVAMTFFRGSQEMSVLVRRIRLSDIEAGSGRKWVRTSDSTGYVSVPLAEAHRVQIGETIGSVSVLSEECADKVLQFEGGKPTFVYFWASWCGPCKRFIAGSRQLASEGYDMGRVRMIGINVDKDCDTFKRWCSRVQPLGDQYAGGGWDCELSQMLAINRSGIPSAALVDPEGKLLRVIVGSDSLLAVLRRVTRTR